MPQLIYDRIVDTSNIYWIWLIQIRRLLRFVEMPAYTDSQIDALDETVHNVMNLRLKLTKRIDTNLVETSENENDIESKSENIIESSSESEYETESESEYDTVSESETDIEYESDGENDQSGSVKTNKSNYGPPVRFKGRKFIRLYDPIFPILQLVPN